MTVVQMTEEGIGGKASLLDVEETKQVDGIEKKVPITYLAEVTGASVKTPKAGGADYISLTLTIDDKKLGRVNVDHIMSLHPNAQKYTAKVISLFGLDPRKLDTDDLLGRFVYLKIKHDSFQSNTPDPITGE